MGYQPLGQFGLASLQRMTMSLSQLRGGVFRDPEFILSSTSTLRSQLFSIDDELGWAILGDGAAYFFGDVFFGENAVFQGDLYSANWNGTIPPNLASVDTGATTGFALDSSEGTAQFMGDVFVGGNIQLESGGELRVGDPSTDGASLQFFGGAIDSAVWTGNLAFDGTLGGYPEAVISWSGLEEAASGSGDFLSTSFYVGDFNTASGYASELGIPGLRWDVNVFFDPQSGDQSYLLYIDKARSPTLLPPLMLVGDSIGGTQDLVWFMPSGGIAVPAGTESQPSLSFMNDSDTGIYRVDSNFIGFTAGGSRSFGIGSSALVGAGTTGGPRIHSAAGTVSAPTYAFDGDTDTGMYRVGSDTLGFATNGTRMMYMGTAGIVMEGWVGIQDSVGLRFVDDGNTGISRGGDDILSIVAGGSVLAHFSSPSSAIHAASGTAGGFWINTTAGGGGVSTPTYTFRGDANTGMFRQGADEIGFAAGGVLAAVFGNGGSGSYLVLRDGLTDVGNHETLRLDRGTGTTMKVVGYFSSWEFDPDTGDRRKEDIISLVDSPRWNREWFYKIRPVDFRRLSTGEREFGFILDEWKATDDNMKYLTTKGDQWGYGPHETAILAAAIVEIQDQQRRIVALEQKLAKLETRKENHA